VRKQQVSNDRQLSLIPAFGAMNHPESDAYNRAKDIWLAEFGTYATLLRYQPGLSSTSQSFEQKEALIQAVSDPLMARALWRIDTGHASLNARIRSFISGAELSKMDREQTALRKMRQSGLNASSAQAEVAEKQRARESALLAQLELKEKLLAYEGYFHSEELARRSRLVTQAEKLDDVVAVITPEPIWHSLVPVDGRGLPIYDPMAPAGTPDGYWEPRFLLSFLERVPNKKPDV